jgi:HK97 family phage portal protein
VRSPLELLRPRAAKPADDQSHPPVPYVGRSGATSTSVMSRTAEGDRGAQLAAMGANSTSFAVVDVLANPTALVEWHLYRSATSGKDEDRQEVLDHPALTLWRKPNPRMVRALFCEAVNQHYELTGMGAMVIYKMGTLPVQLWPCRPDRLFPVPSPTEFLTGWIYQSPDGEKIPLDVGEVLFIRTPNPTDPYGALGPFGSLQATIETQRYADLYNRNYFINSAEPGGILKSPTMLSDDKFEETKTRWRESHRGVAAAHRVAILEGGMTWESTGVTHKDMAYVELDKRQAERIREAKRVHPAMLGITEDVNRANAEAAWVIHGQMQMIPRLERWKQLLNYELLPMFGKTTGQGFEFDYENPVPEDEEREARVLVSRASAAKTLIDAGFDRAESLAACELPEIAERDGVDAPPPAPILAPPMPMHDPAAPAEDMPVEPVQAHAERLPIPALPRAEQTGAPEVNLDEVQGAWELALAALLAEWGSVNTGWQADLLDQIRSIVDSGKVERLTRLTLDSAEAGDLVALHMTGLAEVAAERVVTEARRQGVNDMEAKTPKPRVIDDQAAVTAGLLAASMAISAGREAMRVNAPDLDGNQVADKVGEFLAGLSDANTRTSLGGALTGAQNQARIETFRSGPIASLYANERMDSNTCSPCKSIDGRYIGSTMDATTIGEVEKLYPMGGYVNCLGRDRCRGTITGVWRTEGGDGGE